MIILTAGHTGAGTGAQCITTQFDEGAENIWLRNRVAEILTNKYGLVVLVDEDKASLKLLVKELSRDTACCVRSTSGSKNNTSNERTDARQDTALTDNTEEIKTCLLGRDFAQQKQDHYVKEKSSYVFLSKNTTSKANPTVDDIIIDIHFNAHTNPQARGTEAIVSDDATTMELRFASRLAHATADVLNIPLRSIKSESETPHRRLAMLHLTPQSIILEICFCTSPEDVAQYHQHREQLANALAHHIAELLQTHL